MNKRKIPMIIAIVLIIIIVIVGMKTGIFSIGGSKKPANLYDVYNMLDEKGDQIQNKGAIVLQNSILEDKALVEDGYYVSIDTAKLLNSRFYWDANEQLLVYTTATNIITAGVGKNSYKQSGKSKNTDYEVLKVKDDVPYINIKYIQQFTNLEYATYEEPNRVVIRNQWDVELDFASLGKETSVRIGEDKNSDVLKNSVIGEKYTILDQQKKWTKVLTEDGFIGYVESDKLGDISKEIMSRKFEYPEYTSIKKDYKISMAWHQTTNQTANSALAATTAQMKGVNTISPTWFSLADGKGNITSLATGDYVMQAHNMDLEVWALIDDFSKDDNEELLIRDLLPYTSRRTALIKNIMEQLDNYNIDGINIDFENINSENGENYIQFLRELSIACRKAKKVLSVDNYVASAWTAHYDRKEQGIVCDYLIIMGYDEHTASSEEAGSVASLPFVRNGIEQTIEEVGDSSKVINALPFYTRVWFEDENGSLRSEAVGMDVADESVSRAGATPNWSKDDEQFFAEYESGAETCKVWLEEEESIAKKLDLMEEFDLAGAAYWKLGFERASIWDVISKYFK